MISQLFLLSARGDTIITRDFRGDLIKGTNEIFFRRARFWKGDPPPVFNIEGINFLHIKRSGLYLVATSLHNISPSFVFEMLYRLVTVIKDFCGVLTEEAIRKNFVLVYEIIDEMMDYGYPQSTSTEQVRPFIVNDAVAVEQSTPRFTPGFLTPNTVSYTERQRPIPTNSSKKQKNEIFVDILEKVSVLFNSNGYILNSAIDGCIQMKSYLKNNPQLRLALNDDLVIGRNNGNYGSTVLDDCNFHECVNSNEFNEFKILTINPPDGEFVVMNYRIRGDYQTPFRIFPFVEVLTPYKLELLVKVKSCFPETQYGSNVAVRVNLPKSSSSVAFEMPKGLSAQQSEYRDQDKIAEWTIKKFPGGAEYAVKIKVSLASPSGSKEIGPISMNFEIPMFNVSNLQVKYLRIADQGKVSSPCRWVRYVTQSSSYVCRV
ncbi:unnamed protein product [Blepharisma stoltei]|uniref:MHD domain-containing protein n=1 Tax=Blepharisma stoltei TaxID=1481888 RepID=A0AAU9ITD2_9CILI|nr:unnamed protein product [Blepharisma stoltei]